MDRWRDQERSLNAANVNCYREEGDLDNAWPDGKTLAMRDSA